MDTNKPNKFFWYDPTEGEIHLRDTLEQARKEAQAFLEDLNTPDGWGEDEDTIQEIVVGQITHRAQFIDRHPASTEEAKEYGFDTGTELWEFEVLPVDKLDAN